MSLPESARVARIDRDLRLLKGYAAVMTLVVAVLALTAFKSTTVQDPVLTVERINIVDADGTERLVIANEARVPPPRLGGVEYKRAVSSAGIIFYDSDGNELGGAAVGGNEAGAVSAIVLDYPNMDAVAMFRRMAHDGSLMSAGLQINHAPAADAPLAEAIKAPRRIAIQNENNDAEILLADASGRDRIRLRVDKEGEARIEVLDAEGKVTFSAPE